MKHPNMKRGKTMRVALYLDTNGRQRKKPVPKQSLVQVYFPANGRTLAYYNDRFDLRCGDLVRVSGKLSRLMGRVTAIQYGFRIRLSAYQRVVAVVAPEVDGRLAMAGAYFAAFDPAVLPRETIAAWLDMPDDADDVVCTGGDDTAYALDDLEAAEPSGAKGRQDTAEGRVLYLRLEGTQGYAIVRGEQLYEVTFVCDGKKVSGMTCSCYVYGACKHEYAVLCALRDLLAWAQRNHAGAWQKSGFFSAIQKETLFAYAISGRETGSIRLEA